MMRHDYDYHDGCGAGRVELELSLKPFVDTSAEGCRKVARTLFRQWMPLIRRGTSTAVMLWGADGSEILSEVSVGIPMMRVIGGQAAGVKMVTKAGAFGTQDAISNAFRKLKEI